MADWVTTDPLGRTITLHRRTWYGHIVRGHPEMRDQRDCVMQAMEQPAEILYSRSDADCRRYIAPGSRDTIVIVVVADVEVGIVKTAYLARHATGEREWP